MPPTNPTVPCNSCGHVQAAHPQKAAVYPCQAVVTVHNPGIPVDVGHVYPYTYTCNCINFV